MRDPFDIPSLKQTRRKPFRPRCKTCRTNRYIVPILYSVEITEELLEKERAGEIKIGGSARSVDAPNWHCTRCGGSFLR
jgi:transposase-like protein